MIIESPLRHLVRVETHLPGGFTQVVLFAIDHGTHRLQIPTDRIPPHLRPIGSEFYVITPRFRPEAGDSVETLRQMCREIRVEELEQARKIVWVRQH
jgi:hypothetical protein